MYQYLRYKRTRFSHSKFHERKSLPLPAVFDIHYIPQYRQGRKLHLYIPNKRTWNTWNMLYFCPR